MRNADDDDDDDDDEDDDDGFSLIGARVTCIDKEDAERRRREGEKLEKAFEDLRIPFLRTFLLSLSLSSEWRKGGKGGKEEK